MRIFVSHIHEERKIAESLRDQLRICFAEQLDIFLAEDIPLGMNWLDQIKDTLTKCDMLLVLFSKFSVTKPWVNIEAGYGVMSGKQVVPICHSGFERRDLPVVYELLQAVDLLVDTDIERLLDEVARATPAGRFLGNRLEAVARWKQQISSAIHATPRFFPPIESPPCVWVVGSNRGLSNKQIELNNKFAGYLATALMQRKIRVVFGRSALLNEFGSVLQSSSKSVRGDALGNVALSEFANASAMQKNLSSPPPNPIVILGSFRGSNGAAELFAETIGHVPDVVIVIGGSPDGRTADEVEHATRAGIAVLPLAFTGGVAARVKPTIDDSLSNHLGTILKASRDYASVAQLICTVLEKQTSIRRALE